MRVDDLHALAGRAVADDGWRGGRNRSDTSEHRHRRKRHVWAVRTVLAAFNPGFHVIRALARAIIGHFETIIHEAAFRAVGRQVALGSCARCEECKRRNNEDNKQQKTDVLFQQTPPNIVLALLSTVERVQPLGSVWSPFGGTATLVNVTGGPVALRPRLSPGLPLSWRILFLLTRTNESHAYPLRADFQTCESNMQRDATWRYRHMVLCQAARRNHKKSPQSSRRAKLGKWRDLWLESAVGRIL
jgi:hypothetical protein